MSDADEEVLYFPLPSDSGDPGGPDRRRGPSARALRAIAVVLLVLALASGGAVAWEDTSGSSRATDLQARLTAEESQLTSASAQIGSLQSQSYDLQGKVGLATKSADDQAARISAIEARITTLTTKLDGATPVSDYPVVVYQGAPAGQKLQAALQTQLVDVLQRYLVGVKEPMVSIVITIPANAGDPYSFVAVTKAGNRILDTYGAKGSPLSPYAPTDCHDGCL